MENNNEILKEETIQENTDLIIEDNTSVEEATKIVEPPVNGIYSGFLTKLISKSYDSINFNGNHKDQFKVALINSKYIPKPFNEDNVNPQVNFKDIAEFEICGLKNEYPIHNYDAGGKSINIDSGAGSTIGSLNIICKDNITWSGTGEFKGLSYVNEFPDGKHPIDIKYAVLYRSGIWNPDIDDYSNDDLLIAYFTLGAQIVDNVQVTLNWEDNVLLTIGA